MASAASNDTVRLLAAYRQRADAGVREQLITSYLPLVRRICRRFRHSREPQEDLL